MRNNKNDHGRNSTGMMRRKNSCGTGHIGRECGLLFFPYTCGSLIQFSMNKKLHNCNNDCGELGQDGQVAHKHHLHWEGRPGDLGAPITSST